MPLDAIFFFVRPKYPGNIGSIARVIKNFGFLRLILVNPRCEINDEAYRLAAHAQDVLKNARVYNSLDDALNKEKINYVIGTTARIAGDKHPLRNAITSDKLRELSYPQDAQIAVLLGGEDYGLTNEELEKSDLVVTIPTSKEYPVMNVSHAAAIIAYELSLAFQKSRKLPYRAAEYHEKEILKKFLLELADQALADFPAPKKEIYKRIIVNWVGRAFLTGREVHSLIGFVKRLLYLVKNSNAKNS